MKVIRIILFLLAFIVISTSATINITYPSSIYYWVSSAENEIRWTFETTDPKAFAIFLTNPQRPEISRLAIATDITTSFGKITIPGITLEGTGFQLLITDALNSATNLSTSELFEIKPVGTTPTAFVTPTPTPTSSPVASSTGSSTAASSSPSSTKSSSNSIHNYGSGTLVLITLFIIALFSLLWH